jgi:hypothetical protein
MQLKSLYNYVRIEVFTAVSMKNAVFWNVALCRSYVNRRFGGRHYLHLQGRKNLGTKNQREQVAADCPEDGDDAFLRNVGSHKINKEPV